MDTCYILITHYYKTHRSYTNFPSHFHFLSIILSYCLLDAWLNTIYKMTLHDLEVGSILLFTLYLIDLSRRQYVNISVYRRSHYNAVPHIYFQINGPLYLIIERFFFFCVWLMGWVVNSTNISSFVAILAKLFDGPSLHVFFFFWSELACIQLQGNYIFFLYSGYLMQTRKK